MTESTHRNPLAPGTRLLEYRLDGVQDADGFGITYLAWDDKAGRPVLIEEYAPVRHAARAPGGTIIPVGANAGRDLQMGLERFERRARVLASLHHPNISRVLRYFEANGTGYAVMAREEGESFDLVLTRRPWPGEGALLALIETLLDGLSVMHAAGAVHGAIDPCSIIVRRDGTPVLIAFDWAQRDAGSGCSGAVRRAPGYTAREQCGDDSGLGAWTDIYAMGGVIYRAIVDADPPRAAARTDDDAVAALLDTARGRYSNALIEAVDWALALDESTRPQNIAEWRLALPRADERPAAFPDSREPRPASPTAAGAAKGARIAMSDRRKEEAKLSRWRRASVVALLIVVFIMAADWNRQRTARVQADQEAARLEAVRLAAERRAGNLRRTGNGVGSLATVANLGPEQEKKPDESKVIPPDSTRDRPTRDRESRPTEPTAEELRLWRRRADSEFGAADTNGDGYLSLDEVAGPLPYIAREFERLDGDGDGRISPQEFWRLRRRQAQHGVRP